MYGIFGNHLLDFTEKQRSNDHSPHCPHMKPLTPVGVDLWIQQHNYLLSPGLSPGLSTWNPPNEVADSAVKQWNHLPVNWKYHSTRRSLAILKIVGLRKAAGTTHFSTYQPPRRQKLQHTTLRRKEVLVLWAGDLQTEEGENFTYLSRKGWYLLKLQQWWPNHCGIGGPHAMSLLSLQRWLHKLPANNA